MIWITFTLLSLQGLKTPQKTLWIGSDKLSQHLIQGLLQEITKGLSPLKNSQVLINNNKKKEL